MTIARRPGGRSARVRAEVHAAVLELLGEQRWDQVSIPAIAERSGVHSATIYRRWGSVASLADEVVAERLAESAAIPDTGTLRGDLELAAVRFADTIAGPLGQVLLRAAALSGPTDEAPVALHTRAAQLQAMLDRAAARGEKMPDARRAAGERDGAAVLPRALLRPARRRRSRARARAPPLVFVEAR